MAKSFTVHMTHHAVQLVQRDGFICVICHKCSCCHRDRLEQECRTPEFIAQNHLGASSLDIGRHLATD